jgi:hypothetical protein
MDDQARISYWFVSEAGGSKNVAAGQQPCPLYPFVTV